MLAITCLHHCTDSFQLIKSNPTTMCQPNSPHVTTYGHINKQIEAPNYALSADDQQLNQSAKLDQLPPHQYKIVGMANPGAYFSLNRLPSACQNHHQMSSKYQEIVMQADKNRTLHTATVHGESSFFILHRP